MFCSGTACTDGYPTDDAPALDERTMTIEQRLALMNQIGADAHAHRHWQYRLGHACVLRVSARREGQSRQDLSIDLLASRIAIRHDAAGATYDVQASTLPPSDQPPVTLLESRRWADAARLEWLLQTQQGQCRAEAMERSEGR